MYYNAISEYTQGIKLHIRAPMLASAPDTVPAVRRPSGDHHRLFRTPPGRSARLALLGISILIMTVACAGSDYSSGHPGGGDDRKRVLAPIDGAEVLQRDSSRPRYAVRVLSGLPSGCAVFDRIEVERAGRFVDLTVWNTVPADENVACTMIYGTAENTVEIGGDFAAGETYQVRINGETEAVFTAR